VLNPLCPLAGTLLWTEFLLMGWVEAKRWADLKNPGSQGDGGFLGFTDEFKGTENGYPGESAAVSSLCSLYEHEPSICVRQWMR